MKTYLYRFNAFEISNNLSHVQYRIPSSILLAITIIRNLYLLLALIAELMQTPYYIHYSTPRMMVHKMVTSKYFDLAISAVIGLNVITMAMEFYMMPRVSRHKMCINI